MGPIDRLDQRAGDRWRAGGDRRRPPRRSSPRSPGPWPSVGLLAGRPAACAAARDPPPGRRRAWLAGRWRRWTAGDPRRPAPDGAWRRWRWPVAAAAGLVAWLVTGWPVAAPIAAARRGRAAGHAGHRPRQRPRRSTGSRRSRSGPGGCPTSWSSGSAWTRRSPSTVRTCPAPDPRRGRRPVGAAVGALVDRGRAAGVRRRPGRRHRRPGRRRADPRVPPPRPGPGPVLAAVADSVAEDVAMRRKVEAERAKPRTTARAVTLITLGVLAVGALERHLPAPLRHRARPARAAHPRRCLRRRSGLDAVADPHPAGAPPARRRPRRAGPGVRGDRRRPLLLAGAADRNRAGARPGRVCDPAHRTWPPPWPGWTPLPAPTTLDTLWTVPVTAVGVPTALPTRLPTSWQPVGTPVTAGRPGWPPGGGRAAAWLAGAATAAMSGRGRGCGCPGSRPTCTWSGRASSSCWSASSATGCSGWRSRRCWPP